MINILGAIGFWMIIICGGLCALCGVAWIISRFERRPGIF